MSDYSKYSYRRLLDFLVLENKYDKEGVDYAEYLLTMNDALTIEDILAIYNKVFEKIAYYVFCHSLPDYWFITDSWGNKTYLVYELNKCLNENINRMYESLESPTKEDCISCIVNLRECENKTETQNNIFLHKQFEGIHGLDIIDLREKSYTIRRKIRELLFPSKEEFFELRDEYVEIMDEINSLGFQYTIEDKKFEEIRGIDVNKLVKKKREEERRNEEIERKEKKAKIWNLILGGLILIPLFILFIMIFSKISIIGIIIIIGFLGAIPKIFLTGKL